MRQTRKLAAGAAGAIFVFDLTDMESLKQMEDWIIAFDSWKGFKNTNNEDDDDGEGSNDNDDRFNSRRRNGSDDDDDDDDDRNYDDDDDDDDDEKFNRAKKKAAPKRLDRMVDVNGSIDDVGDSSSSMPRIVIANKNDDKDNRKVDMDKALRICDRYGLDYYECSATSGEGVYEGTFSLSLKSIYQLMSLYSFCCCCNVCSTENPRSTRSICSLHF